MRILPFLKHVTYMTEENKQTELTEEEKRLFEALMPEDYQEISALGVQRRHFLKLMTIMGSGVFVLPLLNGQPVHAQPCHEQAAASTEAISIENAVKVSFQVNGSRKTLEVDSRMPLLDALRERLKLTGSKKGCDHGQCGACTVIINDRRVLSCLTLTATCEGHSVTTIEGLAKGYELHPMQAAFLKHDGYQCGYCTPGQICSAVALMQEAKRGDASYVTTDIRAQAKSIQLSEEEIRERMSGNICRCGAYPNIVAAIQEVHSGKAVAQSWQYFEEILQATAAKE
jgi:xanthine dehydrogenase YagT iron-sulfur-binding subunit